MSLIKVNEIQVFNGTTVTITATTAIASADLTVTDDLDVGGALTLGTALAIAEGGTGSTSASAARTALGLEIGTDIQAYDADTTKNDVSNTFSVNQIISVTDNTNAALRITQTGAGNALVVEDSANPDSTPFVVDANGNVGVGTISPSSRLTVSGAGFNGGSGTFASTDSGNSITIAGVNGAAINDSAFLYLNDQTNNAFIGLTGTGATAGALRFATSSTEAMRIDSSGNVGIGTTSPAQKLDVTGNINATGALTLGTALAIAEGGTGATDAATARTNLNVDQAGTDNSTDVSLVTTSHDYLSIAGQAITLGPIDLATDVTGNLPYASISGTPTLGTAAAEDVGYFATAAQGSLADSAVQPGDDANTLGSGAATDGYVLTADGAGNAAWEAASAVSLPIDLLSSGASIRKSDGTTAVLSESGGAVTLENTSLGDTVLMPDNSNNVSTAPGIRFEADTDTGIGLASAGNLAIVTGGQERIRINSSGYVSIGTTSAIAQMEASEGFTTRGIATPTNTSVGSIQLVYDGTNGVIRTWNSSPISYETYGHHQFFVYGTERMRIDSNGYALIGYTSSNGSYKLQVNSQIFATSAIIATSDGRYKENITSLDGALNLVAQLNPVQFTWKEHPVHEFDRTQPTVGFIAQEVQEVLKETPYVNSIIKANECTIEDAVYETIEISPAIPEELDENGEIITPAQEAVTEQRLVSDAVTEEFLGIAEGNLIALLTKALQEANAKIDALETRIQALEV